MKTIQHPHGFYVDCDGVIRSTKNPREGTYCLFEQLLGFVGVLECSKKDGEVLGEYVWYASIEEINKILKGI